VTDAGASALTGLVVGHLVAASLLVGAPAKPFALDRVGLVGTVSSSAGSTWRAAAGWSTPSSRTAPRTRWRWCSSIAADIPGFHASCSSAVGIRAARRPVRLTERLLGSILTALTTPSLHQATGREVSMKGFVRALLVLACLLSVPLQAAARPQPIAPAQDDFVMPRTDLVKTTVAVGGAELDIYARPQVEIEPLLAGLNGEKAASAADLYQRISAGRQRLYRHEPLVVVGRPGTSGAAGEKAALVRYYYLWNDETFGGEEWFTPCPTNNSTVATLFVALFFGELDFFVKRSTAASYTYIGTVDENDFPFLTYSQTVNKKTTLGYAFDGVANFSESHIIVYCYK
jgi:hypothetical protein